MRNKKWLQIIIIIAILGVGVWTLSDSLFNKPETPARVGDKALNFTLPGLDEKSYKLSELRGQPVVINFWGSWCEPCVRETPLIQSYYEKYNESSSNLVILGINLNESLVAIRSFVKEFEVTYPILLDDTTVRKRYGVMSYPTTVFVDRDGVIQRWVEGEMSETMLASALASIGVPK